VLNKVCYQGRLTKDPELKQTQSGVSKLLFTVAWSEKYKEVETKCFLLCEAWRQTAEFIDRYFHKGQEINLEGHMVTEEWKENEQVTFLVVDKAHFCGSKANNAPAPEEKKEEFMDASDIDLEELPFK